MAKTAYVSHETDPDECSAMWDWIAARYGSYDCCDPETHEMWEYMGTWQDETGHWQHNFRHRSLPPDGERTYTDCPATKKWKPKAWGTVDLSNECPF